MLHVHQNFIPWIVKVLLLKHNYCWYDQAKKINALITFLFQKTHFKDFIHGFEKCEQDVFYFYEYFSIKKNKTSH